MPRSRPPLPRRPSDRVVVSVVFVAAMFMTIMDTTIVNTALPSIAGGFHTSIGGVEGVLTGYLVTLAVSIPVSSWLADRFGPRRTFLTALAAFTALSVGCAVARSPAMLVITRVGQGVGGGMLVPIGTALLFRAFPQAERARASRVLIIPSVLAPAIGPVLGGLLVDDLSWRWCFLINLPIGLLALAFGAAFLPRPTADDAPAKPFDLVGFLCAAGGFAALLYALSVGPDHGWGAGETIGTLVAAALLLPAMVAWELRREHPLVSVRRFDDRAFRRSSAVTLFSTSGFLGLLYLVPELLQVGRGADALHSGLTTAPEAVGVIVVSQLTGKLYPRIGPRRLMAVGLIGVAACALGMAALPASASLWDYRGLMLLLGATMGFVLLPVQTAAFAQVSDAETGRASSLFNAIRQLSAALGVALFASVAGTHPHGIAPFRRALVVAAVVAAIGVVQALRFRDVDAASTLDPAYRTTPADQTEPVSATAG